MVENYIKDFPGWSPYKLNIENRNIRPKFFEKEIWWCNLGVNIGFEQDGKGIEYLRPVLVYKKHNSVVLTAIPLSTKIKENNPFYMKFSFHQKEQSAIISQIRTIDSKRLVNKMGEISAKQFQIIKTAFLGMYG